MDRIGPVEKITLFLYTRGGDTAAAWNIVNLLKMYCDKFEVIIPHKAHSAGTIISLGAHNIVMTKQATLGPIDPSLTTPLNPKYNNQNMESLFPVSVEAVNGFVEFAKKELKINKEESVTEILTKLSEYVHPLVLGQVNRTRTQIKMLAEKLLKGHIKSRKDRKKIISFLCSDSGSHDYTINRREASKDLKLNVIKPTPKQYDIIKALYDDISNELEFNQVFEPTRINGPYCIKRCLVESVIGGSHFFATEGRCFPVENGPGQLFFQNQITYEGWRYEKTDVYSNMNNVDNEVKYIRVEDESV